jgi:integrase/recombinase XerD
MIDLIDSFLEYKRHNQGRKERTIDVYRLALYRLVKFFNKRDPMLATNDDLLAFTGIWLHKMGLEDPDSRRTHVAAVRGFYGWLAERGYITVDPSDIPYPQRSLKIPEMMTLGNAQKLIWAPDFGTFEGVRDAAIMTLLAGCGLRVTGLIMLNQSNIISEQIAGKRRMIIKVVEKGEKQRLIPVPKEADLLLRLYLEHDQIKGINRLLPNGDQVLFVSLNNRLISADKYNGERRRLTRNSILNIIKKYGVKAGLPKEQLHPHALRHLFGTELAEDSVDILVRQRLMGHADPKSTAIYDHMAMRKITEEADRANPLAKMDTPVTDLLKQLKGGAS